MRRIERASAVVTEYGARLEPGLVVDQDERFVLETKDNFFDLVERPEDIISLPQREPIAARQCVRSNPLAGPVYIRGAQPGDALVVRIHDLDLRSWGWTGTWPGSGIVDGQADWQEVQGPWATILRHVPGPSGTLRDGEVIAALEGESRWPLSPFVGTIATAPERGMENSVIGQGPWGGNLDCRDIAVGNELLLNVSHEGGLLFAGDVHGSQGDGELTGIADEVSADICLSCSVIPSYEIPGVCRIKTPDALIQVDSARNAGTLPRAIDAAYLNMMQWLITDFGFSRAEAYVHITANSGVRATLYQACDGLYTFGVAFPRESLKGRTGSRGQTP